MHSSPGGFLRKEENKCVKYIQQFAKKKIDSITASIDIYEKAKEQSRLSIPSLCDGSIISSSIRMTMTIVRYSADNVPQKIKHIIALYTMFSAVEEKQLVLKTLIKTKFAEMIYRKMCSHKKRKVSILYNEPINH